MKFYFKKSLFIISLFFITIGLCPHLAEAKINMITTTEDLAAISRDIGGEHVSVFSIGKGYQNPHFIPPKPSFILKLKNADLLISVGMGLESWLPPLVQNSRNSAIFLGGTGYVNASQGIQPITTQTGPISRSMGDIHPGGNPHYWLDPVNAKIIAANITKGLKRVDPSHSEVYEHRYQQFIKKLGQKLTEWIHRGKALNGKKVVAYHNTWPYFTRRFKLNIVAFIEPKPGIPPSPKHTQTVIQQIKSEHVTLIMMEPYFSRSTPDMMARSTGARVVVLPSSVLGVPEASGYFELFDTLLNRLLQP